jgi:hypothetical protein
MYHGNIINKIYKMKPLYLATFILASLASLTVATTNVIYNDDVGQKGLYYSAGAYCAYETLGNWQCGTPCNYNSGLTNVIQMLNPIRNTFGYAGYNILSNEIVLAFRGTNGADIKNWITNINAKSTVYPVVPNAKVHTGFYQAYTDVQA